MNYLNELSILIAERVKIALGHEELLKIENDKLLRPIILDAAGHVTGVLLDRVRNDNKDYFDLHDAVASQNITCDMTKKIFEKALDETTILQVMTILKEEQKLLRKQVANSIN